ncbi:MAG TPA: VOC family protein [Acidimicrobiales bacterium]|jgi:PhnB protein|nr:VOC family protein [Acidimicrobiales bacterium]
MSAAIDPYLFFPGKAEEAITFYQQVFGGELDITRRGDVDPSAADDEKSQVINATLIAEGITIRASDREDTSLDPQTRVELSIVGQDEHRLRKVFDDLGAGGLVRSPLEKQFWGDIFGALTDKFGIGWQVNIGHG